MRVILSTGELQPGEGSVVERPEKTGGFRLRLDLPQIEIGWDKRGACPYVVFTDL